jgi:hypothetical protein
MTIQQVRQQVLINIFACFLTKGRRLGGFFVHAVFLILGLSFISGCSTNREQPGIFAEFYKAYDALGDNLNLSKVEAKKLAFSAMQVSLNDQHQILMPLGHLSAKQQKWYSQDRFSFTTESGRITQIYNVESEISSIGANALWKRFDLNSIALNQKLQAPITLDFLTLNRFAVKGYAIIQGVVLEDRVLWGEPVRLLRIEEQVVIPSMNYTYTNIYWKDTKTNFIWESVQKWGPDVPEIHYRVVKPWKTVNYP